MTLFDLVLQAERALALLTKFERIGNNKLDLTEKYMRVLASYSRDLDNVRKIYQKNKAEPPIARNLPPIAGKISWARHLYRKIETPMKYFKTKTDILTVSWVIFVKILSLVGGGGKLPILGISTQYPRVTKITA